MSFVAQSPSPNKPNPVWNDQVKVGHGRNDGGAGARAIDVAYHLFKTGKWNGRGLIIIHDVYDTHCNWQTFGQEPELGRDYEFAADSVYGGAGPDEPAETRTANPVSVSSTNDSLLALSALVHQVSRVRAIPVVEDGREIGTRFEVETTDGAVHVMRHVAWRALIELLDAAGAKLTHINLGLDMYCKGTEQVVCWPAGAPRPEEKTEEPTPRPGTVEEAIGQMAAKGKANRPELAGRLDSAAELVREGRVVLDGDAARVGPYTITANSCNCADYVHRGGWCKHRLAVRMARHLVGNGFELPAAEEAAPRPIISEANRRLIASGAVMDAERRTWAAYRASGEGARRWAITALGNGARTLPAHIARRAGIAPRSDE